MEVDNSISGLYAGYNYCQSRHTCFGGHMDVNFEMLNLNGLQAHVTPFSLTFQGITNNIYGFGRLLLLHFFTRPPIFTRPHSFLPIQMTGLYIKLCYILTLKPLMTSPVAALTQNGCVSCHLTWITQGNDYKLTILSKGLQVL